MTNPGICRGLVGIVLVAASVGTVHATLQPRPSYVIDTYAGRFFGDTWPALQATLNYSSSLHVDPTTGTIYVGDSHDGRLRKVSTGGDGSVDGMPNEIVSTLDDNITAFGIASDAAGNIYEANGRAVFRVDSGGNKTRIAGGGAAAPSFLPQPATSLALVFPASLDWNEDTQTLYIVDDNRILKLHGGKLTAVANPTDK